MRRFRLLFFVAFLAAFAGIHAVRAAQANGKITLGFVLSMMDKSAKDFHSLTADLEHIKYTAVVQDTSIETCLLYTSPRAYDPAGHPGQASS